MSRRARNFLLGMNAAILLTAAIATCQTSNATTTTTAVADWQPVEAVMGRPGQMQPGDVIKFGMPRKDLLVSLNGVDIKPSLALGSWVAFRQDSGATMVMATWFSRKTKSNPSC